MRGCLLPPVLVLLLGANCYAIWQIHLLRGEVAGLRADLRSQAVASEMSMADYARDAAEAVGRGEIARAREDLRRIEEMAQQTRRMAQEQKRQLADRLESAREALSKGREEAKRKADELARFLSHD
ncbi:MAG: hypothetical protein ACE149_11250 [Armatimonadota bacterium]